MSVNKPKYKIGQPIICLTIPESCFVTAIDYDYEFYNVKWMIKPADGLEDSRLSFYVAHKYYKEIDKTNFEDLQYAKGSD